MSPMKSALLVATLLMTGPALFAAGDAMAARAAVYDAAQLPVTKGVVAQYSLTPRGDVDGLILQDGTEVHFSPRASTALVFAVKPGDAVTIHGMKAKALPMVMAMSVTNDASGATVEAMGGPGMRGHGAPIEASGTVKAALHGPRGEANGVLLSDGTIIRLPPPEAKRLASELAVGKTVFARGNGYAGALGKVVAAREIGPDASHLTTIKAPHRGERHHRMMRMHGQNGAPMHGGQMQGGQMPGAPAQK